MVFLVTPVMLPLAGLDILTRDATDEGFAFLDRLVREWFNGANRFDKPGETLRGAYAGQTLIAVGGLNIDPFASDAMCGRLRHIYVRTAYRAQGVGRQLVDALLRDAVFNTVRLRTETAPAAAFYRALGFGPVTDAHATHVVELRRPA